MRVPPAGRSSTSSGGSSRLLDQQPCLIAEFLYCFCLSEVAPRLPWCELGAQQLEHLVVQHTRLQQAMVVLGQ